MLVLHPPVEAPIVRSFHYAGSPFARGLHRGVDFGTRAGAVVRVPCDGRVAWAGESGLTLVCSRRRVTLLPLAPAVGEGDRVRAGSPAGVAGDGEPLHLGVRRPGDPFGYEDPERFMGAPPPPPAPVALRPGGRPLRLRPRAAPKAAPRGAPAEPLAPPLAWLGLAVALAGAGVRWRWVARTRLQPARAGPEVVS